MNREKKKKTFRIIKAEFKKHYTQKLGKRTLDANANAKANAHKLCKLKLTLKNTHSNYAFPFINLLSLKISSLS